MNSTELELLKIIADMDGKTEGAYNIRANGQLADRHITENVEIRSKTDNPGIDIIIKPGAENETVHIPVIISETGLTDLVYNDFIIGDGADVTIIAGCGIHNCGGEKAQHDGIHTFFVGKNAKIRYIEKHYGEGDGNGENIMNPTTIINIAEGGYMEMETTQIKGVDSTKRVTTGRLADGATLIVKEKLMTHGRQTAETEFKIDLDGENSSTNLISRSVAKDNSYQKFVFLFPRSLKHPQSSKDYFIRFCQDYNLSCCVEEDVENLKVEKGTVYLAIKQQDVVKVVKQGRLAGLKCGKDFGLLAYNDIPSYEVIDEGITALTIDWEQMGNEVARFVLDNAVVQKYLPTEIRLRNSL